MLELLIHSIDMQWLRIQQHRPDNSDCKNSGDAPPDTIPELRPECVGENLQFLG